MKLTVAGVAFSYNSHPVLSDIHFSVPRGEVLCVLGINGAGKSTLLKCVNRILTPRSGTVLVHGEDLRRMTPNRVARHIGYVPQRQDETRLTVFQAVLMGRRPYVRWSMGPGDYETAEEAIEQMGLKDLAMRRLTCLSGGELQKVAIARALAQTPEVLLLDEPTSSLDLGAQLEVMHLIRTAVRGGGMSAVVAIHDLNTAARFADRFLFMKDGRVHSAASREALTAEMIKQVYGVDVKLTRCQGHTIVVPL